MKNEYPITNIQPVESLKVVRRLFLFLFSPSTPLRAVSPSTWLGTVSLSNGLSNGRFDTRNENLNYFFCFLFSHSTFDVGRSMFDVHFFVTVNGYESP